MSFNRILLCGLACALVFMAKYTVVRASDNGSAAAPSWDNKTAVGQEVLKRNQECNTAELKPDKAAMDDCEAENFTHVHSNGFVEYKPGYIEGVVSGAHHFLKLDWSSVHVRCYGDSAIVDGHEHLMANNKGKIADDYLAVTIVWVKQGGKWREATWTAARVAEGPAQAKSK